MREQIIIEAINTVTGLTLQDVKSKDRTRRITDARFIFSALMFKYTGATLQRIGSLLNRDHSTVIYHLNQYKVLIDVDTCFREAVNEIEDLINITPNREI